ncbi:methyltransferase [Microlunatus panaciterrae]|uniref:SAM-dependent methyltransferase n=1 Tax=Microlunatus panaciterrae TaxID=400768 RepID=A0ABS2RMG9_9ACTN|nr:methyltransferase domain-containing protein [Microlunatus panaciterrae]MBM7800190.1 SAM-dependent methyltransferase [Microlunatus panaciterrae]
MAGPRRRRSVSQAYLLDLLTSQLEGWQASTGTGVCDVVDVGGGTGGLAIALARLGHSVTVIDPSPDALASLERRTAESAATGRIRGVQGDAGNVVDLIGVGGADLVVCHRVLEVVDSPVDALAAMALVLRPGGALSLLVSQRHAVVLSQALAGHLASARRVFADASRFDVDRVTDLVQAAGFVNLSLHGIGAIADHVPEALVESETGAYDELYALEAEISQDPAFRAMAPLVHVFAQTPSAG